MNVNIELKIRLNNSKEIILSKDEAQELFNILKDMFDSKQIYLNPYINGFSPNLFGSSVKYFDGDPVTISCSN